MLACAFTSEEVIEFCWSVGDDNPVHNSRLIALQLGLKGCLVPGLLLARRMEQLAVNEIGELSSFAVSFAAPVYVEQEIYLELRNPEVQGVGAPVRIYVRDEKQNVVALAEVRARASIHSIPNAI